MPAHQQPGHQSEAEDANTNRKGFVKHSRLSLHPAFSNGGEIGTGIGKWHAHASGTEAKSVGPTWNRLNERKSSSAND